jgi:hypothetical protein
MTITITVHNNSEHHNASVRTFTKNPDGTTQENGTHLVTKDQTQSFVSYGAHCVEVSEVLAATGDPAPQEQNAAQEPQPQQENSAE